MVSGPILKPTRPSVAQASSNAVTPHTTRGRMAIHRPILAQKPPWVGSAVPYLGRTGQKIHRPQITSSAGSRVIMASRAMPMPIAATGPSPEMSADSATSRQSMLTMTVVPLAMIAGPALRSASAIAS